MPKLANIKFGHCSIEDLAYWINERHSIYVNRFEKNLSKPWTDDLILQQYKFTNVFRQLDKGTITLQKMLKQGFLKWKPSLYLKENKRDYLSLIFFNICWYRLFNWYEHAQNLGFIVSYQEVENYILQRHKDKKQIFTGAWMTTGVAFEDKHISYLRAAKNAWIRRDYFTELCKETNSMEKVYNKLQELYMIGKFMSYELVCDLRFTPLLENATDKLTWTNMGPGAQRGLKRLGLPHKNQQQGLTSMQFLYRRLTTTRYLLGSHIFNAKIPFELREVEHSLCEFDKYQRVKMGEGRPRSKYNGEK